MATTSGASHAIAAFIGILISGLISNFLGTYATVFTDLGGVIGETVTGMLGVSLPATTTGHLLVATILAFAWGVAYHYARHGTETDTEIEIESEPSPSTNGPSDGVGVPEVLAGVVTSEYVVDEIHTVDRQVQKHISTVLADGIEPRLTESHDRLVAEDQRDIAEQISSLQSDIDHLERSLSSFSAESIVNRDQTTQLKDTHVTLVESATALKATSETLLSATRDGDVESALKNCRTQYRALRDAHETRKQIIEQASDTP